MGAQIGNKNAKGSIRSEKHRFAISISHKGNKYALGYKHKMDFKLRQSEVMSSKTNLGGEKSNRWIKDRTKLKTDRNKAYDTKYKYWMLEVKKRDKWKCRMGDRNCSGGLEAHHILGWRDYPELRYSLNNGITLCKFHHPRKRVEEKQLSPYFQELVKQEII